MGKTVSVGCKLPHGIHADVGDVRVTLNGSNSALVIGGFGVTDNVPEEHIDQWLSLHKAAPYVANELIFKMKNQTEVVARAKDNADKKNGFEGMQPKGANIEPTDPAALAKLQSEAAGSAAAAAAGKAAAGTTAKTTKVPK